MDSAHRRNSLPFNLLPAPPLGAGRLFRGAVCSPLPANPCGSVPGSKIFTQFPRRRPEPTSFSEARFAPRSPQTLAAPFLGAKSSHNFRAAARGRPAFSRRGLLPAPCKPLRLRSGEQILHTISAPPLGAGRLFRGTVCSPLPANPYGSVPGSKIFTQFPRPRWVPAAFSRARFAPPSLLGLVLPSGGANSSHNFRAATRGRPAFLRRGLLPPPCEPLRLRSGEQNLHTFPAPLPGAGRLFRGAVCSPLPARPCSSVWGSKFFTQFPRHRRAPLGRPDPPIQKIPEAHSASGIFICLIFFYLSISSRWDSGVRK